MSTIKHEDIQVGDTIRITREVTVGKVLHDFVRLPNEGRAFFTRSAHLELVNRPLPPLPTEKGAVIAVSREGTAETGIWMLTVTPLGTPRWVSASYVDKTPEGMLNFLQERARTFEVIA